MSDVKSAGTASRDIARLKELDAELVKFTQWCELNPADKKRVDDGSGVRDVCATALGARSLLDEYRQLLERAMEHTSLNLGI